ncbi:unnamed protein product [Discosporangium mesarthrocarpum]
MEGVGRNMIKQANKNKKKKTEVQEKIAQMELELRERHKKELEAVTLATLKKTQDDTDGDSGEHLSGGGGGDRQGDGEKRADEGDGGNREKGLVATDDLDKVKREQKRAKAQRKRDKQRQKEQEREDRIAREKEQAGPDPRWVEMQALVSKLTPLEGLVVKEIRADGHCLYRAVAEQMSLTGRCPGYTEDTYPLMREATARQLRQEPSEYLPFLEEELGEDFDAYCDRVEKCADWGGQVELKALCTALEVPIKVYSAAGPTVHLGEEYEGSPLQLSYHQEYYALGSHYNSLVAENHS